MSERRKSCIEHLKDTESNAEKIDNHEKTLYGNGTPGLKERVTILETNFSAVGKGINIVGAVLGILQILVGVAVSIIIITVNSGKHP